MGYVLGVTLRLPEHGAGEIWGGLAAMLVAYFSLVMARNTTGIHQWARVLKAALSLERAGRKTGC